MRDETLVQFLIWVRTGASPSQTVSHGMMFSVFYSSSEQESKRLELAATPRYFDDHLIKETGERTYA